MSTTVLDIPVAAATQEADLRSTSEGEGSSHPFPSRPRLAGIVKLLVKASFGAVVLALAVLTAGPRLYPFQTFYVRTGSMTPTIPVGGLVVAIRTPASQLHRGDVIVFERPDRPGTMVVHRIVTVEQTPSGPVFVTKGDANASPDSWRVPATGNGWRAVYSMSRVGFTIGWLHAALSRRGWLGTVAIAAAVCGLISIWKSEEP